MCDGLSNATETNDANSAVFLDPDNLNANPSTAHGRHCDSCGQDSCGYISGALNLVDAGTGYYHYNGPDATDTDDWGVAHLLLMIEMACRDYHRNGYPPPGVGVGDLSKGSPGSYYGGGPFDHHCHQNGCDVDIRYIRNDGLNWGLNIAEDPDSFDEYKTRKLISFLIEWGEVEAILLDANSTSIYVPGITFHANGHSDHIHVRMADPDGTEN